MPVALTKISFCSHLLTLLTIFALPALAHEGKHHGVSIPLNSTQIEAFQKIRLSYKAVAEPIFMKKCMDCHGNKTQYPWYYKLPGVRQLIDRDTSESKKHLDMSNGYPFKSHASPIEDLNAIEKTVIQEKSMPPFRYRLLHPSSALNDQEKDDLHHWIIESVLLLNQANIIQTENPSHH